MEIMDYDFKSTKWFRYMDEPMRELATQSFELLDQERQRLLPRKDYSFVIFPMAKAYEGFLKKLFLDMDLISEQQFNGEHFRIGKALNPNLPKRYRSGWVFEKLMTSCGGETLPLRLWEAWKRGRNRIFHFFPDEQKEVTLAEVEKIVLNLAEAMEQAVDGCGLVS